MTDANTWELTADEGRPEMTAAGELWLAGQFRALAGMRKQQPEAVYVAWDRTVSLMLRSVPDIGLADIWDCLGRSEKNSFLADTPGLSLRAFERELLRRWFAGALEQDGAI
jgi:hypothetical protein